MVVSLKALAFYSDTEISETETFSEPRRHSRGLINDGLLGQNTRIPKLSNDNRVTTFRSGPSRLGPISILLAKMKLEMMTKIIVKFFFLIHDPKSCNNRWKNGPSDLAQIVIQILRLDVQKHTSKMGQVNLAQRKFMEK